MIPVILCGGVGARLWPASRDGHPKPFMRLPGGGTLLQETLRRAARIPGARQALAVAHEELYFLLKDDFLAAGVPALEPCCLLEPVRRGTGPAVAAAALHGASTWGEDTPLLVLPADHLVEDDGEWLRAVQEARALAVQGKMVVFGIEPHRPETGYGYIEAEGAAVLRFIEKPGAGQAASFVSRGFLWNAGMVCATPRVILREMAAHCPGLLESVRESVAKASAPHGPGRVELARNAYERAPEVSFDVAVLERAQDLAIVRCGESLGWSDAGSWGEMASRLPQDAGGNHAEGETLLVDSRNSQVHAGSRLVAMLGVEDLLVVDTPDALLIADRSRAAEVKQIHTRLRARGHEAASAHRAVHRPWGVYTVLTQGPRYKVKHIAVKPGAALSLQAHAHRSEHWVVLQGVAQVEKDGELRRYAAGESAAIPAGCRHRLSNPSDNELQLIEVQTGSYVGEDDITRFSDAYGRP